MSKQTRTEAEERAICLRLAQHFLMGSAALVTKESLANFLFEQRDAVRDSEVAIVDNEEW